MVLSPLLGDRLTVRLQPLELRIGVRIPVSQPLPLFNGLEPISRQPPQASGSTVALLRI